MNPANGPLNDDMHSFVAIKRYVDPKAVAGMALYLASDDVRMVTGSQHTSDDGFSA